MNKILKQIIVQVGHTYFLDLIESAEVSLYCQYQNEVQRLNNWNNPTSFWDKFFRQKASLENLHENYIKQIDKLEFIKLALEHEKIRLELQVIKDLKEIAERNRFVYST